MEENIFTRKSPLLVFFDNDGNVSEMTYSYRYFISIGEMKSIIDYAKSYIKKHKTDERIKELNDLLELQSIKDELEYRRTKKPKEHTDKKCSIYLLLDRHRNIYKIGKANNITSRLNQLRTANAGVELVCFYQGVFSDEAALHKMFLQKRVDGEWFRLESKDIDDFHKYFNPKNLNHG